MIKTHFLFSLLFLSFVSHSQEECSCQNPSGSWTNDKGSVMKIEVSENKVSGEYNSQLGTDGSVFQLTGWYQNIDNDRTIEIDGKETSMHHFESTTGFTVHYDKYGSICVWSGYCETRGGVPTIVTQWILSKPYVFQSYEHLVTGNSTFTPLNN